MLRSRLPVSMHALSPRMPCTLHPTRPPPGLHLFCAAHSLWASLPWPGALRILRVPWPLHQAQKDRKQGPRGRVQRLPEAKRSPRVPQALGCAPGDQQAQDASKAAPLRDARARAGAPPAATPSKPQGPAPTRCPRPSWVLGFVLGFGLRFPRGLPWPQWSPWGH